MYINTYKHFEDTNSIEYIQCPHISSPYPGKMYYQRINRMGNRIDLEPEQLLIIDEMVPTGEVILEECLNK